MVITFEDKDLEELLARHGNRRYKKYTRDILFLDSLDRVFDRLSSALNTQQLRQYSYLHYEQLKGTNGLSSVRVMNGRIERLIFREIDDGIEIQMLEMNNDHYGKE